MIEATFNAVAPTPIVAEFEAIIPREKSLEVKNKNTTIAENGEYSVIADDNTVMTEVGIEVNIPYKTRYVEFKDEAFTALVAEKMGWNVGLTEEQVREITTIPDSFAAGNTDIYDISDLTRFSKLTNIGRLAFCNCINVAGELTIPPSVTTLGNGIISNTNIKKLYITLSNIQQITNGVFVTTKLEEVHVDNISKMFNFNYQWNFGGGNNKCVCKIYENDVLVEDIIIEYNNGNNYIQSLAQTQIKTLKIDEGFTTIPTQMCYYCKYLTKAVLPSTITEINAQAFSYSKIETFICRSLDPPNIGTYVFLGLPVPNIYVPDTSVEAYKTATGWSEYASKIKGLSEYTES